MNYPLISIVLCTYNGEKFLLQQLQSLFEQTYPNIEIIISDDASTDNTISILKEMQNRQNVKVVFQKQNIGAVKNFELVISLAQGDYIAFCDQDDIWLSNKIEILYKNIGTSSLIYCDSLLIDENNNSLHKKLSGLRKMYSGTDTKGFIFSNTVWGHAAMIKKELLSKALPIPAQTPHDIWMAVKAAVNGGIKYLDEVLTHYRQHSNTVTTTITVKAKTRKKQIRYNDFINKLYWIGLLKQNAPSQEFDFYNKLYALYSLKEKGNFVWTLFFFMIKHRKSLFAFTRKKFFSQLIEIRKQCRGEVA
ncbi:MAG: glycosyltransferase family 2 protein [Chitinophagales bacterium]|nr:glycosyltransferase family 2 protein [Chitinophagales bacterium]